MKETGWFYLTQTPTRIGVYKTRHRGVNGCVVEGYAFWDGKHWGYTQETAHRATLANVYPSSQQSREWCGIFKDTR